MVQQCELVGDVLHTTRTGRLHMAASAVFQSSNGDFRAVSHRLLAHTHREQPIRGAILHTFCDSTMSRENQREPIGEAPDCLLQEFCQHIMT